MAYLVATTYYLPERVLDNEEIAAEHPEWSVEKISQKTGISKRYISGSDEFSSDMAESAANKLFNEYAAIIGKEDIDFILLCTQSPDYFLPTTACILQDRLGLPKQAGALDFNLGCSGFVYGLGLAAGLVDSGQAANVLLITSETYSKFIHPADKSNKTIFGDAAAATLIAADKRPGALNASIGKFIYGTDGSGYDKLIVRKGGMRGTPLEGGDVLDEEGHFVSNNENLFMDGKAIFNFTAQAVPGLINQTLDKNNFTREEIAWFVFHQANDFMLQTVRKRCGIEKEKFYVNLHCANTVSSTIPIAIKDMQQSTLLQAGNHVLLAGFGVGLSWAATVITIE